MVGDMIGVSTSEGDSLEEGPAVSVLQVGHRLRWFRQAVPAFFDITVSNLNILVSLSLIGIPSTNPRDRKGESGHLLHGPTTMT